MHCILRHATSILETQFREQFLEVRKHHWTWDDLMPPKRSRLELEAELIELLVIRPKCLSLISQLAPMIVFKKTIHGKVFQVLCSLYQTNSSARSSQLIETLNKEIDIGRSWRKRDLINIERRLGPSRGFEALTIEERVLRMAEELIKSQAQ